MKTAFTALVCSIMLFAEISCNAQKADSAIDVFAKNGYVYDTFETPSGKKVNIIFIKHGSLALEYRGKVIYIDPVSMFGNNFSILPKADMILVTHEHGDHFDKNVIKELTDDKTKIITSKDVADELPDAEGIVPGKELDFPSLGFTLTTVPAYNITPGHLNFHPKDRGDLGFIFNFDGFKVYVAGDTEDIPEMAEIGKDNIDVAFIPVNQPYTMTPEQAVHALEMIHTKVAYPYHYGETDLTPLIDRFKGSDIDVRIRQMQ